MAKKKGHGAGTLATVGIGTVSVQVFNGPSGMKIVRVTASNITPPVGAPASCIATGAMCGLERLSGSTWIFEASPIPMTGNIVAGFTVDFPPRAAGTFRAKVDLPWTISLIESKTGQGS